MNLNIQVKSKVFIFLQALILIFLIVLNNLSLAEVDSNRPNLSGYKLKSAKASKQQTTSESVVDLASGAKYLHESLFVKDKIVRCSSYAHLFKIIKQQQKNPIKTSAGNSKERIKQNVIEALVITVADQKELYKSLFEKELRTSVPENFLEATKLLESPNFKRDEHAKGAWLDLISCMSNYMKSYGKLRDPAIVEFLRKEERNEALVELEKEELNNNSNNVPTTSGTVSYMRQKYSGDTNDGRSIYGRFMAKKVLDESSKLVASFDDETSQTERVKFMNKHKHDSADNLEGNSSGKSVDFLEDKLNGIKEPMPDYNYSTETAKDENKSKFPGSLIFRSGLEFNEFKMDLLESVKKQLEEDESPKIDMNQAIDFLAYFEDLDLSTQLDPTSDLGKRAILFHQEPVNRQLLARVQAAVSKFVSLVSVIAELKMQEDRWFSVDSDLRPQLDRLEKLLKSFDPAFNVEAIRQELYIWKEKCSEYSAIHQFIKKD